MAEFDPSFFGMDAAATTPPDAAPLPQDRSTPVDAQVADFNDEANRRLAAGDDPDTVQADLMAKINGGAPNGWKTKTEKTPAAAQQFDPSFFGMPAAPTELPTMTVRPSLQPEYGGDSIGEMPPDFGTGGGALDLSPVGPAARTVGHQIAEETPRALAAGESSLVRFAAALAPALVAGTGDLGGGQALKEYLRGAEEQATDVEKQVAQERAEAKAAGTSSPLSRAVGAVEQAPYTLAQYVGVPEIEGAQLATAAVRSLPASYAAAKQKFMELQPKVGTAEALEAAGLTGIVNEVAGTLPLGAVGSAGARAAAGAIVGAGAEEAQRAGQNVILSDHPELQQQFDPEALVQQAAVGAGLGAVGGHEREEVRNADEIPPDQRGVPAEGPEPQGSREGGGQNLQFAEETGTAARDEGQQVATSGAATPPPTVEEQARVDQNLQPERAGGSAAEPPAAGEPGPSGAAPAGEAAQGAEEAQVEPAAGEAATAEAVVAEKPRVRVPVDEVPVSRVETQEPTPQPDTLAELDSVIRATKADTDTQREARGAEPIGSTDVRHWQDVNEEAKAKIAADPTYPGALAAEVLQSKRPITDTESMALLNDRVRLQNEHKTAMQEAASALDAGDEVGALRARLRVDQIENALDTNERAARYSKSEVARSLNATKAGMTEDYSLAHNVARARVAYGDNWSPSARAEIERLSNALEAKQAEVDAAKAAAPRTKGPARSPDERMQARMKAQIATLESTIKERLTACPI